MFKQHLAAQQTDLLPDGTNHLHQTVGSYMGLMQKFNFFRRAVQDEFPQHLGAARILDAGGQLPVRKGAGAAFSKLHIGMHIQYASLPKTLYISSAGIHILSPLQQ